MPGLIGKKIGMTSVFGADGKNIPCTVIEAGPCVVTQIRTVEKDGYAAVQLAYDEISEKHASKALKGHFEKAGTTPKRKLVEFKADFAQELKLGDVLTVADVFENEYGWPEVDSVRSEICKCLICGLYQAAITLANHLLESVLKKALIIDESAKNKTEQSDITNVFDDATEKYANKNLDFTINQACRKGLINKEEKNILHGFREQYRNAFSHADPQKIPTAALPIPAPAGHR